MSHRILLPAVLLGVLVSASACTHLGVGTDHGAKTSKVVYSITGDGVTTISYAATATTDLTRRTDVELPFKVTVHTTDHSKTLYKVTATPSQDPLTCTITVNDVRVVTRTAPAGQPVTCSFLK